MGVATQFQRHQLEKLSRKCFVLFFAHFIYFKHLYELWKIKQHNKALFLNQNPLLYFRSGFGELSIKGWKVSISNVTGNLVSDIVGKPP